MSASTVFWAEHQVGGPYADIQESSWALIDRLRRYPRLLELMPVNYPGQTVLDYGCGPGHDTILMAQLGADVYYHDASPLAIETTSDRLRLHGLDAWEWPGAGILFKHIHCAGVLHHTEDPESVLAELKQALQPDGNISLMVYDGTLSTHSQSQVPITHWWTTRDLRKIASDAGLNASYQGSYECSADWRPNCYAACYQLKHS